MALFSTDFTTLHNNTIYKSKMAARSEYDSNGLWEIRSQDPLSAVREQGS
jgi:hypothetical protein